MKLYRYGTAVFDLLSQRRKRRDIARLPYVGGAQAKFGKDRLMILTDLRHTSAVKVSVERL